MSSYVKKIEGYFDDEETYYTTEQEALEAAMAESPDTGGRAVVFDKKEGAYYTASVSCMVPSNYGSTYQAEYAPGHIVTLVTLGLGATISGTAYCDLKRQGLVLNVAVKQIHKGE